uniref:beta-1,4-galactosyltransferase 1-like isoform X4 n=1 Tax=Pristiophorus japonicus TaxID=55135 RepID=UPI00398F8110
MGKNVATGSPMRGLHATCLMLMVLSGLHLSLVLLYYLDMHVYTAQLMQRFLEPESPATSAAPSTTTSQPLQPCPETSPHLVGPLRIEFSQSINLEEVKQINSLVREGGHFTPTECTALQKVAVIIPFRNRDEHLKYWLYYLHPILQRQQLDYGVYVINQHGEETFNRAKLLNVGFVEALKEYDYNCFVFSDVDLIPMDDRNIYKCYSQPRHLAVSMDKFGFRIAYKGMGISRPDGVIGKCRMIKHNRDEKNSPNPQRFDRIARTRQTMQNDGLNSLKYRVLQVKKYPLYTFIDVDVGGPGRPPSSR